MSALSSSYSSALTSANLPPIDQANLPADIRNGNAKAKQAYQEALGFEDVLMQQLTQQLADTVTSPGGDASGSGDSSDSSSGGILGSDPSTNAFASLIPTTLTQSIMSGGGVGVADQLARALDPQIGTPQGLASTADSSTASASSTPTGQS
jgi:Rod binding domain-containing protein